MSPRCAICLRAAMAIRPGHEWDPFEGLGIPEQELRDFIAAVPFALDRLWAD